MQSKIEWKFSKNLIDYKQALDFMEARILQIHNSEANELIWFLEHPAIYTAGTGAREDELIHENNIPVYQTGRGGKYTFHGPGQRVIYLMLNLKRRGQDIRKYVETIEKWIIASLAEVGIKGERREGRIGIWVNHSDRELKIAAIGIRIKKWISYHGVAINVNPNLEYYQGIIPCGIREYGVSSLHDLGVKISLEDFDKILKEKFSEFF